MQTEYHFVHLHFTFFKYQSLFKKEKKNQMKQNLKGISGDLLSN